MKTDTPQVGRIKPITKEAKTEQSASDISTFYSLYIPKWNSINKFKNHVTKVIKYCFLIILSQTMSGIISFGFQSPAYTLPSKFRVRVYDY